MSKRVFLIVLDSFGIGAEPDAAAFGDEGTNTLAACAASGKLDVPNMARLGLFNIDGVACGVPAVSPAGCYARLQEASNGKDTTIGHWEIAGLESPRPLPTYPDGFPAEVIREFERKTGRKVLCNKPYSGTQVIRDYGEEHLRTGALIVYTSADSVFQVAAHEDVVPVEELYRYCEMARAMLQGVHSVGRVIARPFTGTCAEDFQRTPRRHDYSLTPPAPTMLECIGAAGLDVIGVGKIYDIFAGQGVAEAIRTADNADGMRVTDQLAARDFSGLAFVNLVDFDMVYGHRRNAAGYALALTEFDRWLGTFMPKLGAEDLLLITADHGCDPSYTKTTDHTREYVPLLAWGKALRAGVNLGIHRSFACVARTVCDYLGADGRDLAGHSLLEEMKAPEEKQIR